MKQESGSEKFSLYPKTPSGPQLQTENEELNYLEAQHLVWAITPDRYKEIPGWIVNMVRNLTAKGLLNVVLNAKNHTPDKQDQDKYDVIATAIIKDMQQNGPANLDHIKGEIDKELIRQYTAFTISSDQNTLLEFTIKNGLYDKITEENFPVLGLLGQKEQNIFLLRALKMRAKILKDLLPEVDSLGFAARSNRHSWIEQEYNEVMKKINSNPLFVTIE